NGRRSWRRRRPPRQRWTSRQGRSRQAISKPKHTRSTIPSKVSATSRKSPRAGVIVVPVLFPNTSIQAEAAFDGHVPEFLLHRVPAAQATKRQAPAPRQSLIKIKILEAC